MLGFGGIRASLLGLGVLHAFDKAKSSLRGYCARARERVDFLEASLGDNADKHGKDRHLPNSDSVLCLCARSQIVKGPRDSGTQSCL